MVNFACHLSSCRLPPRFRRSLWVTALTTAGILSGFVPALYPQQPRLIWVNAALAQSISDDELQNYARSLLTIEPIRQAAYNEIKRILGSDEVPPIACHRPNSLNNLSENIRGIAVNYCNRAIEIVEQNDLTISRFNAITIDLQENPDLADRIQQEMIRLQQGSSR